MLISFILCMFSSAPPKLMLSVLYFHLQYFSQLWAPVLTRLAESWNRRTYFRPLAKSSDAYHTFICSNCSRPPGTMPQNTISSPWSTFRTRTYENIQPKRTPYLLLSIQWSDSMISNSGILHNRIKLHAVHVAIFELGCNIGESIYCISSRTVQLCFFTRVSGWSFRARRETRKEIGKTGNPLHSTELETSSAIEASGGFHIRRWFVKWHDDRLEWDEMIQLI